MPANAWAFSSLQHRQEVPFKVFLIKFVLSKYFVPVQVDGSPTMTTIGRRRRLGRRGGVASLWPGRLTSSAAALSSNQVPTSRCLWPLWPPGSSRAPLPGGLSATSGSIGAQSRGSASAAPASPSPTRCGQQWYRHPTTRRRFTPPGARLQAPAPAPPGARPPPSL